MAYYVVFYNQKMKKGDAIMKYAICANSYRNDGIVHTLCECSTYQNAVEMKQRYTATRGVEFPRIWIKKLED